MWKVHLSVLVSSSITFNEWVALPKWQFAQKTAVCRGKMLYGNKFRSFFSDMLLMLACGNFFLLYWTATNYVSLSGFEVVLAALIGEWQFSILIQVAPWACTWSTVVSHAVQTTRHLRDLNLGLWKKKNRTKDLVRPARQNKCSWHSHSLGSLNLFLRLSCIACFIFSFQVQLKLLLITFVALFLLNSHEHN